MRSGFLTIAAGGKILWKHSTKGIKPPGFDINAIAIGLTETDAEIEGFLQDEDDDGNVTAVDITGATVNMRVRLENGKIATLSGTIVSATDGEFKYTFDGADLGEGLHQAQIEITLSGDLEVSPVVDQNSKYLQEVLIDVRAGV